MHDLTLQSLGCVEEQGDDLFGGEMINPWLLGIAIGVTVTIVGTVINNWTEAKAAFAAGFADGSSGRI